MNMKKYIILIIAIVLAVSAAGCNEIKSTEYKAFEVSWGDGIIKAHHASEYEKWAPELRARHYNENAPKTVTVTFNGTEYTAEYKATNITVPDLHERNLYRSDSVWFEIDSETGELLQILIIDGIKETATVSVEECREIADKLVEQYITIDEFEVSEKIEDINSSNYTLQREYRRVIGKWNTSDYLSVSVDGNGRVYCFGYFTTLNAFSKDESVSFDETKINELVDEKIKSIFGSIDYEYAITDAVLIKPAEKTYGIVFTVSVTTEDIDEKEGTIYQQSELVKILVEIS